MLVLAAIGIVVGYGPSVWWCWFASRRWGSGRLARDVGLRFRWSDAGWGPIVWLAAFGCELAMLLVVQLTGIPLVGNTEGIGDVDADRAYVIALAADRRRRRAVRRGARVPRRSCCAAC